MRPINRLRPWQRLLADATGLALLLTGVVWLAVHYAVGAGAGELPHPAEPWMMKLHGLAAMAALFVFGIVAAGHVPHGWRVTHGRRLQLQRRLGASLLVLGALLAGSGYALYYFVPEGARPFVGLLHSAAGALMAVAWIWHRVARAHRRVAP